MKIESNLPLASTKFTARLSIESEGENLTPQELAYVNEISQSILKAIDRVGGTGRTLLKSSVPTSAQLNKVDRRKRGYTPYTYPTTKAEMKAAYAKAKAKPRGEERIKVLSKYGVQHLEGSDNWLNCLRKKMRS